MTAEIGRGAVATVYRALDPTGRAVAIKLVHPGTRDAEVVERLMREATLKIEDRHVVRTLGSGVHADGRPYLVMELLEGETLRERLGRGMPAGELLRAVREAALGLAAIHAAGAIHRDVRPENLFVCEDGSIKVLDLGLAALAEGGAKLTASGTVIGVPEYLAPEQAGGGRTIDARADVWALGVVLYEGLTGVSPFRRQGPLATLLAAALDPLPPIEKAVPGLPAEVIALVTRCLEKEPERRFATMAELAAALEQIPSVVTVRPAVDPRTAETAPSTDPREAPTLPSQPQAQKAELAPGTFLDGVYRIEKEIGRGAMGTVYLVEHQRLGRKFAAKVVSPLRLENAEIGSRLRNEARIASRLHHENIVDVTHLGQTESGALFIVMELLDGTDLRGLMQARLAADGSTRLPDEQVRALVSDVMAGLAVAHGAGVVHRDLKPANIFVVQEGGRTRAKIVDFGISRSPESEDLGLTRDGQIVGTPLYMAPEQARGAPSVDGRADLYSLAVVCFELLTGALPFQADSVYDMIVKHAVEPPPSARQMRPDLPAPVDAVLRKALAKKPADRYADVATMREAWEAAWQADAAAETDPEAPAVPSLPPAAEERPRTGRGLLLGAVLLLVVAAGGTAVVAMQGAGPETPVGRVETPVGRVETPAPRDPVPDPAPPEPPQVPARVDTPPAAVTERMLESEPAGATVSVGGQDVGRTPCPIEVGPTPVEAELALRGYRRERVSVAGDSAAPFRVTLRRTREAPPPLAPY